jgi:hypothetical protein
MSFVLTHSVFAIPDAATAHSTSSYSGGDKRVCMRDIQTSQFIWLAPLCHSGRHLVTAFESGLRVISERTKEKFSGEWL